MIALSIRAEGEMERKDESGTTDEIEITSEMINAGVRFLERWGVGSELAYPEFVAEFLVAAHRPSLGAEREIRVPRRQHLSRSISGEI